MGKLNLSLIIILSILVVYLYTERKPQSERPATNNTNSLVQLSSRGAPYAPDIPIRQFFNLEDALKNGLTVNIPNRQYSETFLLDHQLNIPITKYAWKLHHISPGRIQLQLQPSFSAIPAEPRNTLRHDIPQGGIHGNLWLTSREWVQHPDIRGGIIRSKGYQDRYDIEISIRSETPIFIDVIPGR